MNQDSSFQDDWTAMAFLPADQMLQRTKPTRVTLTTQQRALVAHRHGNALGLAGPGSGKTRCVSERLIDLIQAGVDPRRLLFLTFTRKAAREAINRVAVHCPNAANQIMGGTFHSMAVRTIRKYWAEMGYSSEPQILGDNAAHLIRPMRERILKDTGLPKREFPDSDKLMSMISKSKSCEWGLERTIPAKYAMNRVVVDTIVAIAEGYEAEKATQNLLDFDDLMLGMRWLLQTQTAVRSTFQSWFEFIMVDEYQDVNRAQYDIMCCFQRNNLIAVGDDCQTIYGFRGSEHTHILKFRDDFPGAQVYFLTQNHRSTPAIVNVANSLIQQAKEKFEKTLTPLSTLTTPAYRLDCPTEYAQANTIGAAILSLLDHGTAPEEITVLYRNGYHANLLDMVLRSLNIPFRKVGGGVKFTEAAHVKDMFAFLMLITNPKNSVAWRRLLTMLPGVGEVIANKLIVLLRGNEPANLQEACQVLRDARKSHATESGILALCDFLTTLTPDLTPVAALQQVWTYYQPFCVALYGADDAMRQYGIDYLTAFAANYPTLTDFLAEVAVDPVETQADAQAQANVTLSTIHSAKGLEWSYVFVLNAVEGCLPSLQADAESEEELRLLYVACTRAKTQLVIGVPERIGDLRAIPCRWLAGMELAVARFR